MKPYLLAVFILIAFPTWADWTKVAESESKSEVYLDLETIRKDGDSLKVWQLTNYLKPEVFVGKELLSIRARYEFDCKQERMRALSISAHSEPNARGEVIGQENSPTPWVDIPPKSVGLTVLNRVCKNIPAKK